MENIGSKCCFCLFLLVLNFLSTPFLYFGVNCRTAELREENKNSCKNIHNDVSAAVLLGIGITLFLPVQIVFCICYFCFHCFCLAAWCSSDSGNNRVGPSWTVETVTLTCYSTLLVHRKVASRTLS